MEELNMNELHFLQKIYNDAIENKHWVFFKWFPFYRKTVLEYKDQAINNTWTDSVFQRLVKDTTENGISDLRQGNFTWEEYRNIQKNWSGIQPEIKQIAEDKNITKEQYNHIVSFLGKQTSGNRPAGSNRIIAAFLPNIVTTVVNYTYLKVVLHNLKKQLIDYPEIENDWLNDNKKFIAYSNSNVKFIDPWHSSVFAWYLKLYFEKKLKLTQEKEASMQEYIDLLKSNKNLILTGAPGTGKTYLAKKIAETMGAETEFVQFHPSYDYTDFVEGLRPVKKEGSELGFELKDGVFKSFCKKALENLIDSKKSDVELSKETSIDEQINEFLYSAIDNKTEFKLKQGNSFFIIGLNENHIIVSIPENEKTSTLNVSLKVLKTLMKDEAQINTVTDIRDYFNNKHRTQQDSYIFTLYNSLDKKSIQPIEISPVEKKNYVMIIDEINRAEISKVFGELFFSIDPGYRGEDGKVKTQYSNLQEDGDVFAEGFYIPENVYIIGTMNDIDRSVESFDFAMRRRFAWKEIKAIDRISMWAGEIDLWKEEALKRMESLNTTIENIQGLGRAFHIGPAYFLKLKNYNGDFEQLWNNHLEGILFEYLRGLPESEARLKELKAAFDLTQTPKEDVENNR